LLTNCKLKNRLLRRMLQQGTTGEWISLHIRSFIVSYSPGIFITILSGRVRWAKCQKCRIRVLGA
jgi:hypothetical protein